VLTKGKIVPVEKIHEALWVGANKKFHLVPWDKINRLRHNQVQSLCGNELLLTMQVKTKEGYEKNVKRLVGKDEKLRQKLASAGIDYEFSGYVRFVVYLFIVCVDWRSQSA
jgi:nucleolar protein 15